MNTREAVISGLDANIPRDVIITRTRGGVELSYLETWYVIDRLNQVLGTDNWSWEIQSLEPIAGSDKLAYLCKGVLKARINYEYTTKCGIGYGSDKSKFNPGEMAAKEAESDALKRAAMKLGRSLGLALYDKTQEYVDDELPKRSGPNASEPAKKSESIKNLNESPKEGGANTTARNSTRPLKDIIKQAFEVLKAQKKIEAGDFKTKYLSGAGISTLSEDQALKTLTTLKTDFPELNL